MDATEKKFLELLENNASQPKVREFLVNNSFLSDCRFVIGAHYPPEFFYGHKIIFQTLSSVFYKKIRESAKKGNSDIYLEDISYSAFKEIAHFAYTNVLKLNTENMLDLLICADKLNIGRAREMAANFIDSHINQDNVFKILQEARQLDLKRTEFKCFSFIEANPGICANSNAFTALDRNLLSDIIKICKLGEHAKEAAITWATKSCIEKNVDASLENMQQELGDLLNWLKISQPTREPKKPQVMPNSRDPKAQNRTRSKSNCSTRSQLPKHIMIPGILTHKIYKEAVLKFSTGRFPVYIQEIHFAFDLTKFDTEFELRVSVINNNLKKDLYHKKMQFVVSGQPFTRFIIPNNGCKLLGGNRNFQIKIEFPESKMRLVVDDLHAGSSNNDWNLKIAPTKDQEFQIIQKIVYTTGA